jgi:PAS domain S-box-containing protein
MRRDGSEGAPARDGAVLALTSDQQLLTTPIAAILDLLPDAAFLYDRHGRIVKTSAMARRLFALAAIAGYDELPYEQRVVLLAPRRLDGQPLPFDEWHITRILRGEVVTSENPVVARIRALDGRELVLSYTGAPLYDAGGTLIGALAIGHDVTPHQAAVDTVQRSEERLRTLVEQAADAILVADPAGGFIEVNASACALLGSSRDELLSLHIRDFVPAEDHARLAETLAMLDAGGVHVGEWWLKRKDGSLVPVEISSRVLADGRRQAIARDITERVRLRREVQAAAAEAQGRAAQLEAVLDAITDGVFVYDAEGHLIRANRAAHAFNPLTSRPDYLARPFNERITAGFEILDEQGRPVPPEEVDVHRVLHGEELTGAHAVDSTIRYPDGHELQVNSTGAPVRDATGAVVGGVIAIRDVTEHRRLARQTREALQALLDMAHALIVGVADSAPALGDASGPGPLEPTAHRLVELARRVVGCERASLLAYDAVSGRTEPLAVSGLAPEVERLWWQTTPRVGPEDYLESGEVASLLAGQPIVASYARGRARGFPTYDASGTLVVPMVVGGQLVGTLSLGHGSLPHTYTEQEIAFAQAVAHLCALVIDRDRLLRQRAASEARVLALEDTRRRMDEFLGIAGHELRTPLTTVKGNVQLAERRARKLLSDTSAAGAGVATADGDAAEPMRDAELRTLPVLLARAAAAADRQDRLVNDLLDVSRIHAGRLEMRPEPCDLATIVRDRVEEQRLSEPERDIRLRLPADALPVVADPDRIGQVVANYLSNALKYSEAKMPVTVSVAREGTVVRVAVRDRGPGLPPEERERVWERFYRATSVTTRNGSGVGLGLGLHIAHTIVERHGGTVGIDSDLGKGSTFWFALPLAPIAAADATSPRAPARP